MSHAVATLIVSALFVFSGAALTETLYRHRHEIIAALLGELEPPQ